jgi:hypothetical protein
LLAPLLAGAAVKDLSDRETWTLSGRPEVFQRIDEPLHDALDGDDAEGALNPPAFVGCALRSPWFMRAALANRSAGSPAPVATGLEQTVLPIAGLIRLHAIELDACRSSTRRFVCRPSILGPLPA